MSKQPNKSFVLRTKHVYGAGIDVHKEILYACVAVKRGPEPEVLSVQQFRRTKRGMGEMCRFLGKYLLTTIVMECTGVYHVNVREALDAFEGWHGTTPTIYTINPSLFRRYAGEIHADARDSFKLAVIGISGLAKDSYIPTGAIKELRMFTRQLHYFMVDVTREKNRLKKVMDAWGLSLPDLDLNSGWALDLCDAIVSTKVAGNVGVAFNRIVSGKDARSHWTVKALQRRFKKFEPYLDVELPPLAVKAIKCHLAAITSKMAIVDMAIEGFESVIARNPVIADQVRVLSALPGIGEKGAACIIAEVGNVHRFKNRDGFLLYVGCAPAAYISGKTAKQAHLSKRVNHFSKRVFFTAGKSTCSVVKEESEIKEIARAQLNKHWNAKKLAWTNTGIKIARVAYTVLATGQEYKPFPGKDAGNTVPMDAPRAAGKPPKLRELRQRTRQYKKFLDKFKERMGTEKEKEVKRLLEELWEPDDDNCDKEDGSEPSR